MVLVDSHRISPVPWYSGTPLESVALRLQDYHLLWCLFPDQLRLQRVTHNAGPTTLMQPKPHQFGLFPFRSPLLRKSLLFSFPPATEMFQLAGFALSTYVFSTKWQAEPAGFPHSDIHGSSLICSFPWLIAAYHVLHRLSMPRHSPKALSMLNTLYFARATSR